jgi:hypothetical protein
MPPATDPPWDQKVFVRAGGWMGETARIDSVVVMPESAATWHSGQLQNKARERMVHLYLENEYEAEGETNS